MALSTNLSPALRDRLPGGSVLPSAFYARSSADVASDLIGKILWVEGVGGGRLTEVEAYLPADDPACHAWRGLTRRNAAMFGPPGCIYVYRSYGVHVLLNLVCDEEGVGSAVLVRSFDPMGDVYYLRRNRGLASQPREGTSPAPRESGGGAKELACGPGRVGQALGLHLGLNGLPLGEPSGVFVVDDGKRPAVRCTTRVGISRGGELPLRYYMAGSVFVSGSARSIGGG